jgi:hypothetical protein
MARPTEPRRHYDYEVSRLTTVIRTVDADEIRGAKWKEEALSHLRSARELLAQQAPHTDKATESRKKSA